MSPARRVLLVFPPRVRQLAGSAYPAPLLLRQYLEEAGHRVEVVDMDQETPAILSDRGVLQRLALRRRRIVRKLERRSRLGSAEAALYRETLEELSRIESVRRGAAERGPDGALSLLGGVADRLLLEEASGPATQALAQGRGLGFLRGAGPRDFVAAFEPRLRSVLAAFEPHVVGLSIPFLVQLVPALLLARMVRRRLPSAVVCIGGPVTSLLGEGPLHRLMRAGRIDVAVQGEGERPLLRLVEERRAGGRKAPHIGRPDAVEPAGGRPPWLEPGAAYVRIPVERYPSYRWTRVPVLQARGCYWGRCAYCDYVNLCGNERYRRRGADEVARELEVHVERTGRREFTLLTEALPPRVGREIAEAILRRGLDVRWSTFVRVDRRFDAEVVARLKESGFQPGTLGMESSNDRLLSLVDKGYGEREVRDVLAVFRDASLRFEQVNVILDLPTTTFEEAEGVVRFCEENRDVADSFAVHRFELTSSSAIGRSPAAFGLVPGPRRREAGPVRVNSAAFSDPAGMTEEEKREIERRFALLNESMRSFLAPVVASVERVREAKELAEVADLSVVLPDIASLGHLLPAFSRRGRRCRAPRKETVHWPSGARLRGDDLTWLEADGGRVVRLADLAGQCRAGHPEPGERLETVRRLVEAGVLAVIPRYSRSPDGRLSRMAFDDRGDRSS